ncbi:glycoside hydrolase family 16 protein [Pseudonocardia sp. C8]|uniref:glycoside hydrolase family 16 protein n=1 Tax=Pseudonocardia sp. C8 TaxID=2762759 RepID=UPI001642885C|nr:glycoside hydrolase family 16 protein [Pseudonocardia sp. C8]MBC3194329.1 glycoside hydrolase family 16 protein [Pseudonocardia sp. C8]
MRRKSSAAADRIDPRDLIERVAAEHSSPSVPSPRAGRSASAAVPATTLLQGAVTASGRHRRARTDDDSGAFPADDLVQADAAPAGTATEDRVSATALDTGAGEVSPWAPRPAGPFSSGEDHASPGEATADGAVGGDGSEGVAAPDAVPGSGPDALSGTGPDRSDRAGRGIRGITGSALAGTALAGMHGPGAGSASGAGSTRELTSGPDGSPVAAPGGGPDAEPAAAGTTGESALVEIDRAAPARRSTVRRFAPLGVGAAAVLAATLVVTLLQPGAEDPSLSTTLVDASRRSVPDAPGSAAAGIGDGGGSALADAAQGASGQVGPAVAAAERRTEERRRQAAAAEQESAEGSTAGSGEEPSGSGPAAAAAPAAGAAQVAGEGIQAALAKGWQAVGGDEFTGSSLGENWTAYDGPGHDGQGRRTPDAVSVENGNLVIRGDSEGNTGGIAWGTPRKYGKWEMRAQFPAGDKQYHPVLLLWPSEVSWPEGGEVDFAETNSAADDVSFFLHYGSSNSQEHAKKAVDITKWNNYAVEWTPDAIVGYINGEEWFRSEDPNTLPPGPMHATVQLDYFPDGGSPQPTEMRVAWMRQYS